MGKLLVFRDISGSVYEGLFEYKVTTSGNAIRIVVRINEAYAIEYSLVVTGSTDEYNSLLCKIELAISTGVFDAAVYMYYIKMISVYKGSIPSVDKADWGIEYKDTAFYNDYTEISEQVKVLSINGVKLTFYDIIQGEVLVAGRVTKVTRCLSTGNIVALDTFNEFGLPLTLKGDNVKVASDLSFNMVWR